MFNASIPACGVRLSILWDICVRYITPLCLAVILINGLKVDFDKLYGGYTADELVRKLQASADMGYQ